MTVLATETITLSLEAACMEPRCSELAFRLRNQLDTPNYTRGVALMPVPESLDEWRAAHRTARKRADRAARLGYRFDTIDRSQHNDAIHEINTSLATRQGRPMSAGYLERHNHGPLPDYPCPRHAIRTYGVLYSSHRSESCSGAENGAAWGNGPRPVSADERLVAYLSLYVVGDLRLVSMILGHGDHLKNDLMYLLFQGVVAEQAGTGGTFFYNRWDSGTEGLRYFKAKLGFLEADLEFTL